MKRIIIVTTLLFTLCAGTALAQGIIIPDDRDPRLPRPIPLPIVRSQNVTVEIRDGAAVTTVDQVFYNEYGRAIEGTYIFPVPAGATVSEFAMWIGGERVAGELLDRDEAARIYREIVRRMIDPGLLELADFNLFRASVFPIPAHGEKRIQLRYSEALSASSGLVSYIYPLKGRGRTYLTPIQSFSLAVSINSSIPITSVYSPTHQVDVARGGDGSATAGMEATQFVPEADFQLYYTLSESEFGLSFAGYREAGEDEGYFMMLVAPRAGLESTHVAPKDVVFVLDTSGSMQDDNKIRQAVRALQFGIRSLGEGDRFGLILFATNVRQFRERLLPATPENIEAALEFLEGVSGTGATNIHDAMHTSLEMIGEGERPRYVVFLTDGLPTHVETDPGVIIRRTGEWAPEGVRIFTFGVGYDVDTRLLDTLSGNHGGVSEYVRPREEMELKLGQFFEKITFPVLTDLELRLEGIRISDVYPHQLPDIFKGTQLVLFGRFTGSGEATAVLSGHVGDRSRSFEYGIDADNEAGGEFIAHIWATRKVGYLLNEIRLHGENDELRDEVVRLARRFGLVTPYTSYLVTEPGMDNMPVTRRRQMDDADFEEAQEMAAAPQATSGRAAVRYSQRLSEMRDEGIAGGGGAITVQRIAGKTFNWDDGFWVDSEFDDEMRITEIEFGSDAYFDLLAVDSNAARWLAIGDKVIIVVNSRAYRIAPAE